MYFVFFDHVNNELECRFPGDQWQMMLGQYHLVYSVVSELSIVFRADVPDLATWRPEIARWRMKFQYIYLGLKISLFLSSNL
jgi:hypothetical protein